MSAAKDRRVAALVERLAELNAKVEAGEQARRDAAAASRALLAEGVTPAKIAELGPYSAAWLRNVRAEMKRRGEIR